MVRIWTYLFMCLLLANKADAPVLPNQQSVKNCLQKCLCIPEGRAVRVQCRERNLTSVPNTTVDKRVSRMDVSFNDLGTLEDNAFFPYESVNYIYLEHCKIHNISEKTFQRLENLTFVDLSDNWLTSIPPNMFNCNHRLQTLKLRKNDLSTLQMNRTLLNGPPSLSCLDLHSCELSNLSSVTFSSLPNLTIIDISKNKLVILKFDALSSHQQLQDVNLENNPFECGLDFEILWNAMQSNLSLVRYRTLTCQHKDGKLETWRPKTQSSLYRPMTTPSVAASYVPDTNGSTTLQPSATQLHNLDTNTSTTLKSSMTPSNKSEASRNTTDNLTTPSEEGNDTIHSKENLYYICVAGGCVIAGSVAFVIYICVNRYRRRDELDANEGAILLNENP